MALIQYAKQKEKTIYSVTTKLKKKEFEKQSERQKKRTGKQT